MRCSSESPAAREGGALLLLLQGRRPDEGRLAGGRNVTRLAPATYEAATGEGPSSACMPPEVFGTVRLASRASSFLNSNSPARNSFASSACKLSLDRGAKSFCSATYSPAW